MKKRHRKALKAAQRHMSDAFESLLRAGAIIEGMIETGDKGEILVYSHVTSSELVNMADCAVNHYHMMDDIREGRAKIVVSQKEAVH